MPRVACSKVTNLNRLVPMGSENTREIGVQNSVPRSAVVAYEDFAVLAQKQRLLERIVQGRAGDGGFQFRLWEYGELTSPQLRLVAVQDALRVDTIFVVANGERGVPVEVKEWFEDWLARKSSFPSELIALLDSGPSRADTTTAHFLYLHEVARKAGMRFTAPTYRAVDDLDQDGGLMGTPRANVALFRANHESDSWLHWGINE
jgi:hypothetical protein